MNVARSRSESCFRPPKPRHRVVVTGLGLVTPLGLDVPSSWEAVLDGRSGISRIDRFDTTGYRSRIGGLIRGFDPTTYFDRRDARRTEPYVQYGVAAACQALEDSGLKVDDATAPFIGVAMGSGIGGLGLIECERDALRDRGPSRVSPLFVPQSIINMVAGYVAVVTGAKGPCFGTVTACASGSHTIGEAARMVERGDVDAMIAGASEAALTPLGLAGFCAARALSERNDDPQGASRPWDKDRDGFVLADGAGAIVIESLESALTRGATIYAELIGFSATSDAYHITMPPPDGEGARRCMVAALLDADVSMEAVGYVNAHATSTRAGDIAEARALEALFGPRAHRVLVSSTKSMTGHLLGAAGSVEAVFTILALRDQIVPPTINLEKLDGACNLEIVAGEARNAPFDIALTNSFGFGGTNAALVFGRYGADGKKGVDASHDSTIARRNHTPLHVEPVYLDVRRSSPC